MSREKSMDDGKEDLKSDARSEAKETEVVLKDSANTEPAEEKVTKNSIESDDSQAGLMKKLEETIDQVSANRDRYLRAVAELENYRKRALREKEELRKYGAVTFIEDLLPVIDSLRIGLDSVAANSGTEAVVAGFALVFNQLREVLKDNGVSTIEAEGALFDPNLHEAVAHHPSDEVGEGYVIAVTRAGYTLHDRLIRAVSVVVSSGKPSEGESK